MAVHRVTVAHLTLIALSMGTCTGTHQKINEGGSSNQVAAQPTPTHSPVSDGFAYPIGSPEHVTQSKDGDGWYNAQDFGEHNHLGEDWNGEAGGDSDCGQPVYATSKGEVVFAEEAGPGWGKVVIVRHRLPDDTLVETLYGHLQSFTRANGRVERREIIGTIGNADGAYPCHLHFELRFADSPAWGLPGDGYASNRAGWTDPSNFIDAHQFRTTNR